MSNLLEKYDTTKILKTALKNGGDFSEIFIEKNDSTTVILDNGKIDKLISGMDSGAGVRAIHDGHTFYGYSNDLSEESILNLAETVSKAISGEKPIPEINLSTKNSKFIQTIRKKPDGISLKEKISLVERGNRAARSHSSKIFQVTAIYRDYRQDVEIANSLGELVFDERVGTVYVIQSMARENEIVQTGYEPAGGFIGFELFDEFSPEEIAEISAKRAVMMLSARKAPAGKMPVILSSSAGGTMIHEAVGHGLEADLAQNNLSVYSRKIGEKIASELITVADDKTISNKRGSFSFDDEGTFAEKTILIENGILKNYMYDRLTAMKDGKISTGNGRRESYRKKPIPRMTNTCILPGNLNPEEIIRSVDKGLFVKKMGGGQVNTVNGDFVFEITEGYLIENGKIAEPVRGATLTGNGPDVLNSIDMVGTDWGFGIGTCGKDGQGVPVSDAQPTLRIPEIIVGGEA